MVLTLNILILIFCITAKTQEVNQTWIANWISTMKWTGYDEDMLKKAESTILSYVKSKYRGHYIELKNVVDPVDKIWTLSFNEASMRTPLVLLHGLASGSALWVMNFDELSAERPVHAIDVLGFARSSRPKFSKDAMEAETQLVQSVEAWREKMKIDKMVVLGHSMGGFLASAYALNYPNRVKHLILADPWGFPEKPVDDQTERRIPMWAKPLIWIAKNFYPLSALRGSGPMGQWLIEKLRPDLIGKFAPLLKDDYRAVPQYIHQCNAQRPSGESAFNAMMKDLGWAQNPMILRIGDLQKDVPMTFIYGARSWVDSSSADLIINKRPPGSYVQVHSIPGAGHHLYCERSDIFNSLVNDASRKNE